MADVELTLDTLRSAVQLACQPQNVGRITAGRRQVLAYPRAWVLEQIERVAVEVLDLSDNWEYRRLLELAVLLDAEFVQRFVRRGLDSADPEVREAAEEFQR
jgi:hypothetical protein